MYWLIKWPSLLVILGNFSDGCKWKWGPAVRCLSKIQRFGFFICSREQKIFETNKTGSNEPEGTRKVPECTQFIAKGYVCKKNYSIRGTRKVPGNTAEKKLRTPELK